MDASDLLFAVEEAVHKRLEQKNPFTTVDISHPIIAEYPEVRHSEVRTLIREMDDRGEMEVADFEMTMIQVTPRIGKTAKARLWHPSDADPDGYQDREQKLDRPDGAGNDSDNTDDSRLPVELL